MTSFAKYREVSGKCDKTPARQTRQCGEKSLPNLEETLRAMLSKEDYFKGDST